MRTQIVLGILRQILPQLSLTDMEILLENVLTIFGRLERDFHIIPDLLTNKINFDYVMEVVGMLIPYPPPGGTYSEVREGRDLCKSDFREFLEQSSAQVEKTIDLCKGKLMPNGRNIFATLPSITVHRQHPCWASDTKMGKEMTFDMKGLSRGDIYNVLTHDLWYNVRDVKWLLYEERFIPFYDVVYDYYHTTLKQTRYDTQNTEAKQYSGILKKAIRYGLLFMENYNSNKLPSSYKRLFNQAVNTVFGDNGEDDPELDAEQFDVVNQPSDEEIEDALVSLGNYWLEYLNDCFHKLSSTYYATSVINAKSDVFQFPITKKLMYSFFKAFTHFDENGIWETINDFQGKPVLFDMLRNDDKNKVLKRLSRDVKPYKWFKVISYIIRNYGTLPNFSKEELEAILKEMKRREKNAVAQSTIEDTYRRRGPVVLYTYDIYDKIIDLIPRIVYVHLAQKGVLSLVCLDGKNPFEEHQVSKIANFQWGINEVCKDIELTEDQNKWVKSGLYFTDWLPQLSLYHRFFHSRIMYLSGATGTGKSTQVPKLLMYAMYAFNYRIDGRLICSEPRKDPTTGNSTRISREMGLPDDKGSYNQYKVQFSHSDGSRIPTTIPYNLFFMRFVTDGTLLEALIENPFLIELYDERKGVKKCTGKSIWDVVIVDEAHEHNMNMDLILSLMKNTMKNNMFVSLVIMSATMDTDELLYRNFFRDIDDNLKYPRFLTNNTLVDRRVHFGRTTNYQIDDIYLDDVPLESYDDIEALGVEKVMELSFSSTYGDILMFSIGESNIKEVISVLNDRLPQNFIALPYYSDLPDNYRNAMVKDLKEMTSQFRFTRKELLDKLVENSKNWNPTLIGSASTPSPYTRAVVVATNVAEASITIPTLRYVVDTGHSKKNRFDATLGGESLTVRPISESSRLQRRGRVGRSSAGYVYYMYKEGAMREIRQSYDITTNDIYVTLTTMLSILREKSLPLRSIMREYYDASQSYKGIQFDEIPRDVTDPSGSFYLIHPDEEFIERVPQTGRPLVVPVTNKVGSLYWIDNVYRRIPGINKILYDHKSIVLLRKCLKSLPFVELSILNVYSMFLSLSLGGKRCLEIVAEILVGVRVMKNQTLREDLLYDKLHLPYVTEESIKASKGDDEPQTLEYKVAVCLYRFEKSDLARSNISVPALVGLSIEEAVYFSLYYSNPLSIGMYDGRRYINAFSEREIDVEREFIDTPGFGYFTCREEKPSMILPLNNLCFRYIIDGYRNMGPRCLDVYT